MDYFLFEESGDSETKDYFDPNRNKAIVVDAEDAESCCSDSSQDNRRSNGSRRMKSCRRIDNIAQLSTYHEDDECYNDEEADYSSRKVLNNVIDDHEYYHVGVANKKKKKLENSVSESFIISSGVVNNNMDEITDDRLFWEACLANGYP